MSDVKKQENKAVDNNVDNVENKKPDGNINGFKDQKDLNRKASRKEVIDIVQQVMDNVNQISHYLMEDVNTLYSKHVFPFQIQVGVMEDLLVEKGLVTEKELNDKYNEKIKMLQEKAREIKEDKDGNLRVATKDEERVDTNERVLKALKNNERIDKETEEINKTLADNARKLQEDIRKSKEESE